MMMPDIVIYLLKSIACSGILYGYYRLAFYNRVSHQWNRFFLLSAIVVSMLLPLLKFYIPGKTMLPQSNVVRLLNVVASDGISIDESVEVQSQTFDATVLVKFFYVIVSSGLLFLLIRSLLNIYKIYRSNPKTKIDDVDLVMTDEKAAPFSFFKNIFWNTRINLESAVGKRILDHEMVHVQQLHSADRLLMNIVTAMFWCNPFYWLIRKELIVVHEFMADRKAIHDNNAQAFSEMVLLSAFPQDNFGITSTYFNSSIKRRLTMLTEIKNSTSTIAGKWLMLPLMLIMLAAFSFRKKEGFIADAASPFVVMIDAGHGGNINGTTAADGTMEKDLNLSLAKKIRELNTNDKIKIVLTRETDEATPLRDRVTNASKMGVDAFLSIHFSNNKSFPAGIQLMMTNNASAYAEKSQLLGSVLMQELSKEFKVDGNIKKGAEEGKGVWVLDAPEINYPSLLIECGNLSDDNDLKFIKSTANQAKLALLILNALNRYAAGVVQVAPKAVELLVEKGDINIDLKDNKVIKADFSGLKTVSTKNILAGDNVKSNGVEIVIVDRIYMGDNVHEVKHLVVGAKKKLIIVSTNGRDPLSSLMN
ncbi:MAG TPA: N-acetylmuramoyl-L-alanine amidase [Flavitalea sp.]|nr:N-acetylmuramoyl-L-alanine amidase [Flavitalea sp.]